jgi:hypothetical protein
MNRIHLKKETATTGFYYLDHEPTGKVFTGTAKNMQAGILGILGELKAGTLDYPVMLRLWKAEPLFTAKCFPTKTIREARALEKEFRKDKQHLLLNTYP